MRKTGFAAAAVLLATTPGAAQNQSSDANWQEILACAREPSDARRHACMDAVLDRAGMLAEAQGRAVASAEEQRRTFGLSPAQQQEAGRPATQAQRPPVAAPAPAPVPAPPPAAASEPALARAPVPPPPALAPPAPPQAASADVDSIATTVSRAFDPGNRLLVIITADGQVWQQSESKDIGLPPRPGVAFTVEQGALGSFTCRIGTARSFRCRRQG